MRVGALRPYERSLRTRSAPLALHAADGRVFVLDVDRWLAGVDGADETVLGRCASPTLDVGCGPGRFVASLTQRGVGALGLDIAETAVAMVRRRGVPALLGSVFCDLPAEGEWRTVLLMDGNIGIDGDPRRLLTRLRDVLAPGGQVIVEVHPGDPDTDEHLSVRFGHGGTPVGPAFTWSHVGASALADYARATGYSCSESWSIAGRSFTVLDRSTSRWRSTATR